jgi:hypothetical protein
MKTNRLIVLAAIHIAMIPLMSSTVHAQSTNPSIPVGWLTAYPTVVQTGTKPSLTWNINYPSIVKDYVIVTPPGTVTAKQNLICDVRILGAGVTTQNSNGTINYIQTKGQMRIGSSSWSTVFDGKNTDTIVQQQGIIKTYNVTTNQTINFAGQYYWNNAWSSQRTSQNSTYVKALVNGDACPARVPDYNAPTLESFIKPYLDATNKVRIGPMDVIIFMELTHTSTADVGYDEQDLVFLVTFRTS